MNLELVYHPNEILSTKCEEWDMDNPPMDAKELKKIMFDKMKEYGGIGISANQLGLNYRVFAMQNNSTNNLQEREMIAINPEVIDADSPEVEMFESCLSIPDVILQVKRPHKIKVAWTDEKGRRKTETFSGYTARVFLHELDHLDGISMDERVSPIDWKQALEKAQAKKKNA